MIYSNYFPPENYFRCILKRGFRLVFGIAEVGKKKPVARNGDAIGAIFGVLWKGKIRPASGSCLLKSGGFFSGVGQSKSEPIFSNLVGPFSRKRVFLQSDSADFFVHVLWNKFECFYSCVLENVTCDMVDWQAL